MYDCKSVINSLYKIIVYTEKMNQSFVCILSLHELLIPTHYKGVLERLGGRVEESTDESLHLNLRVLTSHFKVIQGEIKEWNESLTVH